MTAESLPELNAGRRGGSRAALLWMLVLLAAPILLYSQTLSFDYVNFDDNVYVYENEQVLDGLSMDGVRWAFTTAHYRNVHPITWLSHMTDIAMFGPAPGMQHGMNVAFHALNGVLLFLLLRAWTGDLGKSAAAALLFAVHPLHVEPVAWISQRKELLGTFFLLFALGMYTQYVRQPSRRDFAMLVVASALAMLAKPALFVLPGVLLLIDFWPLKRFGNPKPARQLLLEKTPLMAIAVLAVVGWAILLARSGAGLTDAVYSWPTRLSNALVAAAVYAGQTIWPARLAPVYPHPGVVPPWLQWTAAGLLVIAITGAAIRYRARCPFLLAGWGWFLLTIAPQLGIARSALYSHADRNAYLPMTGLLIAAVWGVAALAAWRGMRQRPLALIGAAAIGLYALMAYVQTGHWQHSGRLWKYTTDVVRDSPLAHQNLGVLYLESGELDEAEAAIQRAFELSERQPLMRVEVGGPALNSLGAIATARGEIEKACALYAQAVERLPNDLDVRSNWGEALLAAGRPVDAVEVLREVTDRDPSRAANWNTLAVALLVHGNIDASLEAAHRAAALDPNVAEYRYRIALAEFTAERYDTALGYLHQALALHREYPEAVQLRAEIYSRRGIAAEDIPPLDTP